MTPTPPDAPTLRERLGASRASRRTRGTLAVGAVAATFALMISMALAPPTPPSDAAVLSAYADANAQEVEVEAKAAAEDIVAAGAVTRDDYDATQGIDSLKASGTNHDWAKLVLLFAGFPMSESNVTVITRWMRQENYVDSWWNRNNPLNNGWGATYGPGGTGSNVNLVEAARNAADALLTNRGYAGMVAAFRASESTASVESAIWASPWASGHYNNGAHWHYTPVEVIKAPASAWG